MSVRPSSPIQLSLEDAMMEVLHTSELKPDTSIDTSEQKKELTGKGLQKEVDALTLIEKVSLFSQKNICAHKYDALVEEQTKEFNLALKEVVKADAKLPLTAQGAEGAPYMHSLDRLSKAMNVIFNRVISVRTNPENRSEIKQFYLLATENLYYQAAIKAGQFPMAQEPTNSLSKFTRMQNMMTCLEQRENKRQAEELYKQFGALQVDQVSQNQFEQYVAKIQSICPSDEIESNLLTAWKEAHPNQEATLAQVDQILEVRFTRDFAAIQAEERVLQEETLHLEERLSLLDRTQNEAVRQTHALEIVLQEGMQEARDAGKKIQEFGEKLARGEPTSPLPNMEVIKVKIQQTQQQLESQKQLIATLQEEKTQLEETKPEELETKRKGIETARAALEAKIASEKAFFQLFYREEA